MLDQLSFKGQWRQYQQRILDKSESFMGDGKIHLVAVFPVNLLAEVSNRQARQCIYVLHAYQYY